jgi:hypothetical protein
MADAKAAAFLSLLQLVKKQMLPASWYTKEVCSVEASEWDPSSF